MGCATMHVTGELLSGCPGPLYWSSPVWMSSLLSFKGAEICLAMWQQWAAVSLLPNPCRHLNWVQHPLVVMMGL